MGLEIVDIENYRLRTEACKYDSDNNGDLNENEFSIFRPNAKNLIGKEGVSEEDFNQAIGLYKAEKTVENNAAEGQEEQKLNDAKTMFNAYVDAAKEEKLPLNYDQILKDVKKELKEQNKYNKKEFKELEKYVKAQEERNAYDEMWLKIQEHSDETNGKKLRKNLKKEMETDGVKLTKYQKKALKKLKEDANDKARANNVEQHRFQTEEEILKRVDKDVFERLIKNGLIEKAPDDSKNAGKYDILQLQTIIARQIGPDNTMDTGLNNFESERRTLRSQLSIDLGYNNEGDKIDKGDRNDLVRLSGMKVPHGLGKILGELAKSTLLGATIGAATGTVGNKLKPTQYDIDPNIHVEQATKVVVDVKQNVDIQLPEGATLIENGTKVVVNAQQIVDIPGGVYALSKLTGWDAAIGAVAGGLAGLIGGIPSAINKLAEENVANSNFKECDFDKYVEFEKTNNPKYAPTLEKLAGVFLEINEDGTKTWHRDKYREFLNLARGDRSNWNKKEVIGAKRLVYEATKKGKAIVNDCGELILGTNENPQVKQEEFEIKVNKWNEESHYETKDRPLVQGRAWLGHIYEYDCLMDACKKIEVKNRKGQKIDNERKAVRALKIIQAIKPESLEKYINNEQALMSLVQTSYLNPAELKNNDDIDYANYQNVISSPNIGKIYLPDNLLGCDRNKNNYRKPNFRKANVTGTKATTTKTITVKVVDKDGGYSVKAGNQEAREFKTKETAKTYYNEQINANKGKKIKSEGEELLN